MYLIIDVVLSVARHLVSERVRPLKYSGSYQRYATNFCSVSSPVCILHGKQLVRAYGP